MTKAYLKRIGTAIPDHDIHEAFVNFAAGMLVDTRARSIFQRLVAKSGIGHRYSCLQAENSVAGGAPDAFAFYREGHFPATAERMKIFERCAPLLMRKALDKLALSSEERNRIRHVVVSCCTGFYAPGLDFDIIDYLGLPQSTERTMVGFMGCYAAINALKLARHIVRSQPCANVLVVNLELCTLHFHETQDLGDVLAFLLFGDGCAASLVSGDVGGLKMDGFDAVSIENSRELITWRVGNMGFDMFLSTQVPAQIAKAMKEKSALVDSDTHVDLWAVHPGGRAILDAVETGLALLPEALQTSRAVLSSFGNMSSATVMFVLQRLMENAVAGQKGCAISFGPGVVAEIMRFHVA